VGLCRWRRGAAEQVKVKVKVKVQSAECRVQSAECRVQRCKIWCTGAADMVVLKC
jgi:hypothetical protein